MGGRVLLLPWIQLDEKIAIGDVVILPFAEALEAAKERADQLRSLASIYVDGYTLPMAIGDGHAIPYLKPAVIFVTENDQTARLAQDAVDILMLATIFENGLLRANGATFAITQRYLDGERGFMVDTTPTMYGTRSNMIGAELYLEMRPPRTGGFHYMRKASMVDALLSAMRGPFAQQLRRIYDTLRTATSESADVSIDLAESLLAKVAMLVIHVPGLRDDIVSMLARLRELLNQIVDPTTGDEYAFHIARVWQVVRDHRNDFWHPERRAGRDFPFMQQRLVSPMTLAMRMIHALLSARLIELGCADRDSELRDNVVGVENWLATLGPSLEDGLADLSGVKLHMEHNSRAQAAEARFLKFRSEARLARGIARHLADFVERPD